METWRRPGFHYSDLHNRLLAVGPCSLLISNLVATTGISSSEDSRGSRIDLLGNRGGDVMSRDQVRIGLIALLVKVPEEDADLFQNRSGAMARQLSRM